MPAGNQVRPHKWSNVIDLYDDGDYSLVWGCYDNSEERCLGVRWNGDEGLGFPNQSGYPVWHVEPGFLTKSILLELLDRVNNNRSLGDINNILTALREFWHQSA